MPRDQRAYLADIIDSCEAIELAVAGLDLSAYTASRLVRSSVERGVYHNRRGHCGTCANGAIDLRGHHERSKDYRFPESAHT